jgi:aminoglycoside phosphotransferase (APT) family kinase protein
MALDEPHSEMRFMPPAEAAYLSVIAERFGIPVAELSVSPLAGGLASNFILVARDQRYFVKVDTRPSRTFINDEQRMIARANEKGVRVCPLNIISVQMLGATLSVRPWIDGIELSNYDAANIREPRSFIYELGQLLRRIHGLEPCSGLEYHYACFYNGNSNVWSELDGLTSSQAFIAAKKELNVARDALRGFSKEALSSSVGAVHGDFKPANLLVVDETVVVLDWEKSTLGSQMVDLGFSAFHLFTWLAARNLSVKLVDHFLEGYNAEDCTVDRDQFLDSTTFAAAAATLYDALLEKRARELSAVDAERRTKYFWQECLPNYRYFLSSRRSLSVE